jgi:hypothetical protein
MSREHWHAGSRSDYITSLALSRSQAENNSHIHFHPKHDLHAPKHVPVQRSVIPDLRFEPTYMAKLASADPGWQSVLWITVRDQVISPLLQGMLWCVCVPPVSAPLPYLTWSAQGHRVCLDTAFGTVPYRVAVSITRQKAPKGRQRCGLAPPVGPLTFSRCQVGECVGSSMMRSCALGALDVDDMGTCWCPSAYKWDIFVLGIAVRCSATLFPGCRSKFCFYHAHFPRRVRK